MRIPPALGLALVLLATAARGQSQDSRASGWFRVSWERPVYSLVPRIAGQVHNDSPFRVTAVRLRVEGLDADSRPVGQAFVWALGAIEPGGRTTFAVEPMPGAVTYRIAVASFDVVSGPEAP
ncbi:MAG: FxLYD domain-containing protein [Candidatus Rokuibacteriota bacterium]